MRFIRAFFVAISVVGLVSSLHADDWPRFLGPGGASVGDVALPSDWSVESGQNIAWKVDTPGRAVSGPIVVNGKVFVTASGGVNSKRLHVLAFDSASGEQAWHRQFWALGRTNVHDVSAVAANTPATDGQRIFAMYSSNELICLDLEGNLQWMRALTLDHPGLGNDVGMAASPVVAGGAVVVQCECQLSSFAAGYDVATGKQLWHTERPNVSRWTTPVTTATPDGEPAVVLASSSDLAMLNAMTGEQLWSQPLPCAGIPSPALVGDLIVAPANGVAAFSIAGAKPELVWREGGVQAGNASPIVSEDRVFVLNGSGVLSCVSRAAGEQVWRKRLGGSFWATPVLSHGKLFCINDRGDSFVVAAANGEILSKPSFGQPVNGSPAVADGGLFVRGISKLWKIAHQGQAMLPPAEQTR